MNILTSPLVSVIVPIYNVENYLQKCIESVLSQSYQNLELILVNDGSPDNSESIIKHYASLDCRVIPINQSNGGVSSARNKGIKISKGKYILFLDADDYYSNNFVEKMVKCAENNKCDLVSCSFIAFGIDKVPKVKQIKSKILSNIEAISLSLGYNSFNGYVWNKLFKRSIIEKNSLKFENNKSACEDLLFLGKYLNHCKSVFVMEDRLYNYRQNNIGANRSRYSEKGIFDLSLLQSIYVSDYFINYFNNALITDAAKMHQVRESGIILRSMVVNDSCGLDEYRKLKMIVRKNAFKFILSKESSYYQKVSILLTFISPKIEVKIWRFINK